MIAPRLVICGGAFLPRNRRAGEGRLLLELDTHVANGNVHVRIGDLAKVFLQHLTPRLRDLLEIVSYVYAADTAVTRGTGWDQKTGLESWSRKFHFVIPVRESKFWNQKEVKVLLARVLRFLTDSDYEFDFRKFQQDDPLQGYLEFGENEDWPFYDVERVLMFSGGLDSLAGAVQSASEGKNLVLVSHRPMAMMDSRQRKLFERLKETYPRVPMLHVPVWVNKDSSLGKESTQRTRSFLYSALGFVVAQSVRAKGVRFFENGIVSLNFPVADEVVGARASRTTHPWVLDMYSQLYTLVAKHPFVVDNPYLSMTKEDVVRRIADCGGERLIGLTCSCSHTFWKSKQQWHCGTCSQCIDRRIAVFAAGQEANDPQTDYESDVFIGTRRQGYEQNMAVNYVRHGLELANMSDTEMSARFNAEMARAVRNMPNTTSSVQCIIEMHRRHGQAVTSVLNSQMTIHAQEFVSGVLESTSMLALIAGQKHLQSSWVAFGARIVELLGKGLPSLTAGGQPKNEPELQRWCDGILKSNDLDLVREYPFMRWASAMTKPDWSNDELSLWIELKYVRKTAAPSSIANAIAADVTSYGDNGRRVLFLIYDPEHAWHDREALSADVERHDAMFVRFLP